MRVIQLPAFEDNYLYLLRDGDQALAIDPGDPHVILDYLERENLSLKMILNTHHHPDHVGGNRLLKEKTGCTIWGPEKEREAIPELDHGVKEGDILTLGSLTLKVLETPGHTKGHVSYRDEGHQHLFCGDTLFSMGCGRVFEGDPEALFDSLQKIKALPPHTKIYCAHEYTLDNLRFALSVNPHAPNLLEKQQRIQDLRGKDIPTVPTLLEEECALNPFLRAKDFDTFYTLRCLKDRF